MRSLVAKVLVKLKELVIATPATQHAASQLLLRIKYLICIDTDAAATMATAADLGWDGPLVAAVRQVVLPHKVRSGAAPRADLFNRAVVRWRRQRRPGSTTTTTTQKGSQGTWTEETTTYPSALHAVQELTFGSTKVRLVDPIDEVEIGTRCILRPTDARHTKRH